MAIDDRMTALESNFAKIQAKRKDFWDKLQAVGAILVPIAIAVAGQQFASNMKQAEIAAAENREAHQQSISMMNARVSQADVLAHFLDALTGTDQVKQRVAIRAVLIALPEEGPALVSELTAASQSQATQAFATGALSDRLQTLVAQLYDAAAPARISAYEQLTSVAWRSNPAVITPLLAYARGHLENDNGIYNTVVVLKDLSRTVTQPRKGELNTFCAEAARARPRIVQRCGNLA